MKICQRKGFAAIKELFIVLLMVFILPNICWANHELHESYVGKTITMGSELDYPPYAAVDENGNADGYSVDLMKAVAKQVGIKLRFEVGPWSEVKARLERGEIDALPLVAYSKEREKHFDFSHPHIISHAVAFVRKGQSAIKSIADLQGKEVVVMRSDSTHEYVLFSNITDKIILTDTVGDSFKLLASGKHDFVIAPKLSGLLLLRDLGINNIIPFGEPLEAYGKGYSFAVHEGNSSLLKALDRGLVLVKASGEYDQIYDKWFGDVDPRDSEHKNLIRNVIAAALLVALLLLLAFIWNLMLRRKVNQKTKELKASEIRFAATFAETAIGLAHVAPDGNWLRVNKVLCEIVGYSEKELLELTFQDITHPDDLNTDLHFVKQMLTGEIDHYALEKRYIRKDGSTVWINLTVTLILKENGEPDYFISAIEDISERKQLDREMEQERNLAQKYLDVAGVMMVAIDPEGDITLINGRGLEILGYEEGELLHKNWFDTCLPAENREEVKAVFNQLMHGEKEFLKFYENPVSTKSGEQRIVAFHNALLTDDQGNITGLISSGEDVTESKLAAEKLLKLSQAVEQSGEAVVITDVDGKIEYINSAFTRITGYELEDAIGKNPRILKSGDQGPEFYKAMWDRLTSGKVWQGRVIDKRKDGSIYPAMVTISPLKNDAGTITHYVGVQQSLKKYEELELQFHQSQKM